MILRSRSFSTRSAASIACRAAGSSEGAGSLGMTMGIRSYPRPEGDSRGGCPQAFPPQPASRGTTVSPRLVHAPPVEAVDQRRHLGGAQPDGSVARLRPAEGAGLEPLRHQHHPVPSKNRSLSRSARFERKANTVPENGSAPNCSRTSMPKPSMPLRKSTGRVASMTRTAPVGPITTSPSRRRSPPRSPRRRRPDPPAPRRRRSRVRCSPLCPPPAFAQLRACRWLTGGRRLGLGRHDDGHEQRPLGRSGTARHGPAGASRTAAGASGRDGARRRRPRSRPRSSPRRSPPFSAAMKLRRRPPPVKTSKRRGPSTRA